VGHRRAEDRHHGVAHEFLDEAVVALDRSRQSLEQRILERADLFGVEPFREGREAGEVGEEDGHLPPVGFARRGVLGAGGGLPGGGGGRAGPGGSTAPGRAAARAEREVGLAQGAARRAGRRQLSPAARAKGEIRGRIEAAAGARHRTE